MRALRSTAACCLFFLLRATPAQAKQDRDSDTETDILARLRARHETLADRYAAVSIRARAQLWTVYRLSRRDESASGFLANPDHRIADAQARALALTVANRSLQEAQTWREELTRSSAELDEVERRARARADDESAPRGPFPPHTGFHPPVRGSVVGVPGMRRDAATGTLHQAHGLMFLARMNETVHAPLSGVVRHVAPLPQGGFAAVLSHPRGWTSVLSGLRQVAVAPGTAVAAGQVIGLVGRNLDGAPMLTLELWHGRRTVDPRTVLTPLR